jgi:hypothetical protein
MSIIVVCPGCRKSFKVSDQYAGKSGPCPSCKRTLKVPEKSEEVKVHAPEAFEGGGRSRTGKLIIKPDAFVTAKLRPATTALILAAALTVFAVAWVGGRAGLFNHIMASAVGLLAVSPPLVVAAYAVLRDAELEPYRGKQLCLRASLCALAYAALWGLFSLLVAREIITGELWNWIFVVPPFVVAGGLFATASLDLEFGDGLFHFGFYLVATIVLRWAAGLEWVWNV